jgi:glycosyltransferase involved in cell wall biosynthesis/SAM-dependent methyltransferase
MQPLTGLNDVYSVAVVITTYNHSHFLSDAIRSVLAQSRPANEIFVIDDGSTDRPDAVVAQFTNVRLIRQANQGLSSARNAGLSAVTSNFVVFLDADDRLLKNAIADGLALFEREPESGFIYGGHRRTSNDWRPIGSDRYTPVDKPYLDLLRGNPIGMHATVMYSRERLQLIGGFDQSLPRCEDYDVYLRMAKDFPISSHPAIVAEYRIHGDNMSNDQSNMLRWVLKVHGRQKRSAIAYPGGKEAWRRGRRNWRSYYCNETLALAGTAWLKDRSKLKLGQAVIDAIRISPRHATRGVARQVKRFFKPPGPKAPRFGRVRFGDFARTIPIDDDFGFGRGTPIDRLYITDFLLRHAKDIAGRVLEVEDDEYSRRFGGTRVAQQDILHVRPGNPRATIVGDLASPNVLPAGAFDCLILTQTLHFIYDMHAAVREIYRALKPNGVVLLTVPGISRIDRGESSKDWRWSLTEVSARRMFSDVFGVDSVKVETHGNVFAATAFLQGVALEEVPYSKLTVCDPAFPVIVTVRAQRSEKV